MIIIGVMIMIMMIKTTIIIIRLIIPMIMAIYSTDSEADKVAGPTPAAASPEEIPCTKRDFLMIHTFLV